MDVQHNTKHPFADSLAAVPAGRVLTGGSVECGRHSRLREGSNVIRTANSAPYAMSVCHMVHAMWSLHSNFIVKTIAMVLNLLRMTLVCTESQL